jgi:uncharacterized membrane protein YfcA
VTDRTLWWRVVLVGAIAGFTSGLFGVGGGIVIVPTLVIIAGFEQRLAHGTSLAAIVIIAATGTIGYGTEGEVQWATAAAMVAGGLVGTVAGTSLLQRVSQPKLQAGFAILLLATAIRMLVATPEAGDVPSMTGWAAVGFVALGFAAGLLAGLMGVGGGIITVPALTVLAGFPLVVAKGTSLAVIVPSAIVGTMRNRAKSNVDLRAALTVGIAGIATAYIASKISLDLDPDLSARLFAALLVVTALRMANTVRKNVGAPAPKMQ